MRKTCFSSKMAFDIVIEFPRRIQIMAKWLFDDDADAALLRLGHALRAKSLRDRGEVFRGRSQVKQPVAASSLLPIDLLQQSFQ